MQTANPKTAQAGGNTSTTPTTEERRVCTAPGQLSAWQAVPDEQRQQAPAVVPVTIKRARRTQSASSAVRELPAWSELSFVKSVVNRGFLVSVDWFAVPDEPFTQGKATGYRVAKELMQALVNSSSDPKKSRHLAEALLGLIDAVGKERAKGYTGNPSRAGAASSISNYFACLIGSFAKPGIVSFKYLDDRIAEYQSWADDVKREEQQKRAEFVQRMQSARKARQQERLAAELRQLRAEVAALRKHEGTAQGVAA